MARFLPMPKRVERCAGASSRAAVSSSRTRANRTTTRRSASGSLPASGVPAHHVQRLPVLARGDHVGERAVPRRWCEPQVSGSHAGNEDRWYGPAGRRAGRP